MKIEEIYGITYQYPMVTLLHASPLVNAELAGRVCYDSFENSEHEQVRKFTGSPIEDVEHSDLLDSLCHVYHHMSIAEHVNLTYLIKGTSRAVLQEHARHRIQAISVRSTRYTMSSVINAFVAEITNNQSNTIPSMWFVNKILSLDLFVTSDRDYNLLQVYDIFSKLKYQHKLLGHKDFLDISLSKSNKEALSNLKSFVLDDIFNTLESGKKKKNVADNFKHIVTDNFKTDMVVTFNLRSLKNYFELRASNAAWFQIQWLAEEMIKATPKKYLDLIIKPDKLHKILNKK